MSGRYIVACPTQEDFDTILDFAEKRGWGAGRGCFRWSDYGSDSAIALVGTEPNGYAPLGWYLKYDKTATFFNDIKSYFEKVAPEVLTQKSERNDSMDPKIDAYLTLLKTSQVNLNRAVAAIPIEALPEHSVREAATPQFIGRIDVYRYVIIKNSDGEREVPEEDFQNNPTMQKSPNVTHYVRTTISMGDVMQASATCLASDYDERQGILEAMGNLVCQNFCDTSFQSFYEKMQRNKAAYEKAIRKCPLCGTEFKTPDGVSECLRKHAECKKASAERRKLRRAARYELKIAQYRERIEAMKEKLKAEDGK